MAVNPPERRDAAQYIVHHPDDVSAVMDSLTAYALIMYGSWLTTTVPMLPPEARTHVQTIGQTLNRVGNARVELFAGLSPHDVSDTLQATTRMWDVVNAWLENPDSVPADDVLKVVDQFAGAMQYLDQRMHEVGTGHPRWVARLADGVPCETCGR